MQQELRALTQQTGRSLTMAEARQYGVDRMVLARLVNDAALDGEAQRLGLSTGDDAVRAQVMATPAFQGSDGNFDRETYAAALERAGLRPADFEELLRREATRDLLARGVQSAATMPDTAARPSSPSSASGAASTGSASTPPSCPSRSPRPPTPTSPPSTTPTPPTATPAPRRGRSPTPA